MRSVSIENVSWVFIESELGTNIDFAAIDVLEKVNRIINEIPEYAKEPVILKVDVNCRRKDHSQN